MGWCLITPPWLTPRKELSKPLEKREIKPYPQAPYRQWKIEKIFSSLQECEADKERYKHASLPATYGYATCLATDDPRLK
jgi:hypothetical protein